VPDADAPVAAAVRIWEAAGKTVVIVLVDTTFAVGHPEPWLNPAATGRR